MLPGLAGLREGERRPRFVQGLDIPGVEFRPQRRVKRSVVEFVIVGRGRVGRVVHVPGQHGAASAPALETPARHENVRRRDARLAGAQPHGGCRLKRRVRVGQQGGHVVAVERAVGRVAKRRVAGHVHRFPGALVQADHHQPVVLHGGGHRARQVDGGLAQKRPTVVVAVEVRPDRHRQRRQAVTIDRRGDAKLRQLPGAELHRVRRQPAVQAPVPAHIPGHTAAPPEAARIERVLLDDFPGVVAVAAEEDLQPDLRRDLRAEHLPHRHAGRQCHLDVNVVVPPRHVHIPVRVAHHRRNTLPPVHHAERLLECAFEALLLGRHHAIHIGSHHTPLV